MGIEGYFRKIQETLENCAVATSFAVSFDKRGAYEGFIRGRILFINGTVLEFREFVDVEDAIDRMMYVYQYMDSSNKLTFRYDNTGHHKKLNLHTYPHHKHAGSDKNILASDAPDLKSVLEEIQNALHFS